MQTHGFGHAWLWHVTCMCTHTHFLPGMPLATCSHDQHCQNAAALHDRATLQFSGVYKAWQLISVLGHPSHSEILLRNAKLQVSAVIIILEIMLTKSDYFIPMYYFYYLFITCIAIATRSSATVKPPTLLGAAQTGKTDEELTLALKRCF